MSPTVDSIQITAISHATEDPNKVAKAIAQVLSSASPRMHAEKRTVKGHFGNPITTFLSNARGKQTEGLLYELYGKLGPSDQTMLLEELGTRIDEDGRLHLRFDKQDCFRGKIRLEDEDSVKVTVSLRGPNVDQRSAVRFFKTRLQTGDRALT